MGLLCKDDAGVSGSVSVLCRNRFFEIMYRVLQAKVALTRQYPDMALFAMKAYYEKDPGVHEEIQKSIDEQGSYNTHASMLKLDRRFLCRG